MKSPKTQRFHMRLTVQEEAALKKLAEKQGVSMSDTVRSLIQSSAKRRKLWMSV